MATLSSFFYFYFGFQTSGIFVENYRQNVGIRAEMSRFTLLRQSRRGQGFLQELQGLQWYEFILGAEPS